MKVAAHAYAAGFGLALAIAGFASSGLAAAPGPGAYQGAWAEESLSCDTLFVTGPKGSTFRKPVDIFVSAFIISGKRITTPQATCGIASIKANGDRDTLALSCSSAVSVGGARVLLARAPDGILRRFYNEDDTSGTRYKRCSP